MIKTIYGLAFGSLIFLLAACNKFTDITPKGSNLLKSVDDLDLLLNFNYSFNANIPVTTIDATSAQTAFAFNDVDLLVDDVYLPVLGNVPTTISSGLKTLNYAFLTDDSTVDRITLTATDIKYERLYFIISNVANTVISKVDAATGDRVKANRIKAEAYTLRAYFHFMLVNFYAKAYNPATAATDGGIPYVKEDNVITVSNKKSTVAEVYTNILSDLDSALNLNSLPDVAINTMRVGKAFTYAVKAEALLSMRNYTDALVAANASLAINNNLQDDRTFAPVGTTAFAKTYIASDNLFFACYTITGPYVFSAPSLEILNNYYEPGNIVNDYVKPYYPTGSLVLTNTGITSKAWYTATTYSVSTGGLTTSDMYRAKAECLARSGDVAGAMSIINYIRQRRIHPSVYQPFTATTTAQAMAYLMKTSRIECLYTYKNYLNIKRWNTEDAYKQTITRTVGTTTYSLTPTSPLWIFPFPQSGTSYNTNLTQNY